LRLPVVSVVVSTSIGFDNLTLQHGIPEALDDGISTLATSMRPPSTILTDANPLNMALVSNDPSFWPTISFYREYSYFTGLWSMGNKLSCSIFDHGCSTVASFTIVVYDWGEQDEQDNTYRRHD
jgi:hypothetical protein